MNVLLLKDVKNVGKSGEVKKVANGYALNFLIPNGKAIIANDNVLKMKENKDKKEKLLEEILKKESLEIKEILEKTIFDFSLKGNTKSDIKKAYGSLHKDDLISTIETHISKKEIYNGFSINSKNINLETKQNINVEGTYKANLILGKGISANIKFNIKIVD